MGGGGGAALLQVRGLADMVCAAGLEAHLGLELRWLGALYGARVAAARAAGGRQGLSMELVLDLLVANEEVGGGGRVMWVMWC